MLEQIVRPFQLFDPTAGIPIIVQRANVAVQPAVLSWGQAGELPTAFQEDEPDETGINFKLLECDENLAESKRDTEDVRVENPDDPSQFVVVQRIKSITFKKANRDVHTSPLQTYWEPTDFFAGSPFGEVEGNAQCRAAFTLKNV